MLGRMTDAAPSLAPLPDDWSRALAIVAHPDDLEYGAASAVAKWTAAGKHVSYLLANEGEAGIDTLEPAECARVREAEERGERRDGGRHDRRLPRSPRRRDRVRDPASSRSRDSAIRRARPELLVTLNHHDSWGGRSLNMADHRNVGLAALDASRDVGNRWVFPDATLEPWGGVRYVAISGSPTRRTRSTSAPTSRRASRRSSATPRTSRTSAATPVRC